MSIFAPYPKLILSASIHTSKNIMVNNAPKNQILHPLVTNIQHHRRNRHWYMSIHINFFQISTQHLSEQLKVNILIVILI